VRVKIARRVADLPLGLVAVLALSGCAPEGTAAATAAEDFHRAVASSDMAAACSLLQPTTREETAQSGESGTCEGQLEKAHFPDPGDVVSTEVYGRNAFVEFDNDVVFLAVSEGGWRVTGAGCSPRGDAPYTCEVGGK
jgi:hypothetical protein